MVEKAKPRGLDKSSVDYHTEIHHIVPRSLGGTDETSNLVMLTAREHYIAHLLLWKMDKSCIKMMCAFMFLSSKYTSNSRLYEKFKTQFSEAQSKRFYKKEKNIVGHKFGRLTVKYLAGWKWSGWNNLAVWMCECDCGGSKPVISRSLSSGTTRSCGCLIDEYNTRKVGEGNPFFGKTHTECTKEKIRQVRLSEDIKPWETPLSKKDPESMDKWAVVNTYFDIWLLFEKPSRRKLRTIYNTLFNDEVEPDYFKNQVKKFEQGWNPYTDSKWKDWSELYLRGDNG